MVLGPAIAVVSPKSTMILIGILALAGLMSKSWQHLVLTWRNSVVLCFAALALWACTSGLWSLDGALSLKAGLKFALTLLVGFLALAALYRYKERFDPHFRTALQIGFALAILVIIIAVAAIEITGKPLWGTHSGEPLTILAPPQALLVLLSWAIGYSLYQNRNFKLFGVLFVVMAITCSTLRFEAALVALCAGSALACVSLLNKGRFLYWFAGLCTAIFLAFPFVVSTLDLEAKIAENPKLIYSSTMHRLYIWRFSAQHTLEHPLLGHGMDSARILPGGHNKILWGIEQMPLHPHNGALQIWLELGFPGIALALIALVFLVRRIVHLPDPAQRFAASGLMGSYLIFTSLSFGIWQTWWIAATWLASALLVMFFDHNKA